VGAGGRTVNRAELIRQILAAMKDAGRDPDFMSRYLPTATDERLAIVHSMWCETKYVY
jgi:hypothetical protein